MSDPAFLTREWVEWLHRTSLEQHGGQDGLRDASAFESALAAPLNAWHFAGADVWQIAATYAFHIAQNQPFIDGNKRTAVLAALLFLEFNGYRTTAIPDGEIYDAMIAIAEKRMDKAGLADVFRRHLSR